MNFNLFSITPGLNRLISVDAADYLIVAASNDLLNWLDLKRDQVIGKPSLALSFPRDASLTSHEAGQLKASYEFVIRYKQKHQLSRLKYEFSAGSGQPQLRVVTVNNIPCLDDNNQLKFILHHEEDITGELAGDLQGKLASEDLYKAYQLFWNSPMIIGILHGPDYKVAFANKDLLEVWGKPETVIGLPLFDAIPELSSQGLRDILDQVRLRGEPFYVYEFPISINHQGIMEEKFFDFIYKPIYDTGDANVVTGIISVGHEVTTQVLAHRKLLEKESRYRNLFESMDQGFCVLEMIYDDQREPIDYRFLEINPVFERQTGLHRAVGKTALELVPDLERHWLHIYNKIAVTGESLRFVEESKAMGRWFDVYAFRIDADHQPKVALLFTDISENKIAEQTIRESEERFRMLADVSPIFIYMIDPDPAAPVIYWNKTWLDYTGQTMEEALGTAWSEVLHPEDIPGVMAIYSSAFEKREPYYMPEVRVKRKDGKYRWHAFKANPRFTAGNKFMGYVGVGFDIHEQKLHEQRIKQNEFVLQETVAMRTAELEQTIEELKRSNQNLQEFAYAASHDLKEPMRKIQIFSGRIKDSLLHNLPDNDRHYFDRITSAISRMNTLIDDLLSYSNAGMVPLLREEVDLNKKLALVLEDLELEIAEKKATITIDELPVIYGHRKQIQQLFQNLISNALKYSRKEVHPHIRISASRITGPLENAPINALTLKSAGEYYHIEVRDNGLGFSPDNAERIFNVFTRLHGSELYKGSGVGLAIARKVMDNHQGYIWAEAQPNEGAVFHILFPVTTNTPG